jgi:hypothetical protein
MAQSGAPKLDGPAIDPTTALMAPLSTAPDQAALSLEAPVTGDTSSSLARFESAAAPAPAAENINVLEFAARLQAEFGDDVRILDVGASAWDDSVLSESVSEVSSLASPDVRAGASLDLEIPVPEGVSAVMNETPDLAKPASRPPAFGPVKDFFAVNEVRSEKNLPDADGLPSMSPVMAPLAEVPVEFKEQAAEAAPKSEPVDVAVLAANRGNVDMPVAETAEAPAADKSERLENSSRHAAETVRKIQDAVRRTAVSDIGAMRLDLSSPETGNVEIAVRVDGDQQVDVRVMAASGELRDLLARELPQLKNALGEQNLNLRDMDVRSWTSGSGQQSPSDGFARQGGQDEWREAANRLSSGISGARSAATSSIDAIKGQMGRQALRAFRILDMTERSGATGSMVSGRIKVLV